MPYFIFSNITFLFFFFFSTLSANAFVADSPVIMRSLSDGNMCALTFDDGPSQFTPKLLDSLQQLGIKATFFVLGQQVEKNPHSIQRMIAEGHEIANHSYSHPNMRKLNATDQYLQLNKTKELLDQLGVIPKYFRPPYGNYTPDTVNIAAELGMSIILWSTDSRDWKRRPKDYGQMNPPKVQKYYSGGLRGIFLFHDTKKNTVEDLPLIVSKLQAGGCSKFVTVSEYFHESKANETLMVNKEKDNAPESLESAEEIIGPGEQGAIPYIAAPAGNTPIPLARSYHQPQMQAPALLRGDGS